MGTVLLSLLIGLIIRLFISIVQAIRVYRARAYMYEYEHHRMLGYRDPSHEVLPPDWHRAGATLRPVFNIIGFPIFCSLVSFIVTLIVMFFIK